MTRRELVAFIDEAGQRSVSEKSSDHFVLSAVVMDPGALAHSSALLARLRTDLRRSPHDTLHWRNLKRHSDKLRAAQLIEAAPFLRIASVVVCKRHLPPQAATLNDDAAYLATLRYLLERVSWLSRDEGAVCAYTLAHIVRFKLTTLREYEALMKSDPTCTTAWEALDPRGGTVDQPSRLEHLQLADFVASATAQAFEPDRWGNTEPRYLQTLTPRLHRRASGPPTSHGLHIHPWNAATQAAYPWTADL